MNQIINTKQNGQPFPAGTLTFMNCIISFPTLFTPKKQGRKGQEQGDPKYSATLILPVLSAEDNALLNSTYEAAVQAAFPNGLPPTAKTPWKNAADASAELAGRLCFSANAREQDPPRISSLSGPLTIHEQSQIFSGCIVAASVKFYGYDRGVNSTGMTVMLNSVRLLDNVNVTRLDGRLSDDDAFGGEAGMPAGAPPATAPVPHQPAPVVAPGQQVQQPAAVAPAAVVPGAVAPGAPAGPAPGVVVPGATNPLS